MREGCSTEEDRPSKSRFFASGRKCPSQTNTRARPEDDPALLLPGREGAHFPAIAVNAFRVRCARIPARKMGDHGDDRRGINGSDDPDRAARTPLPGRRSLTRRRHPYRLPDSARRPTADARSPRASGLNNSINIDKFTGFFDKLPEMFGDFLLKHIQWFTDFRRPFPGQFRVKNHQGLCKIQAGYFSTRRFAMTMRWMSFVPSPTCRRMESR